MKSKTTSSAVKPVKKRSKVKSVRKRMSLAEVEAAAVEAAAAAIKSKKLSVSEKARKLEVVAELLAMAKEKELSKTGEWLLAHVNDPAVNFDPANKAVLR
ncbi:hypothetical protein R80B4_02683 [Fibrobacteres bacterium R8-0-B4]